MAKKCCSLQGTGQCGCDHDAAVVPRKATPEIRQAAQRWFHAEYGRAISNDAANRVWEAMLKAAP